MNITCSNVENVGMFDDFRLHSQSPIVETQNGGYLLFSVGGN